MTKKHEKLPIRQRVKPQVEFHYSMVNKRISGMNLDEQQDLVFLENVGLDSLVVLWSFSGTNNIIPRSFIIHLYTSLSSDFFHNTYHNTFPAIHNNFDLFSLLLICSLVAYVANNMDPDQTAPLRAV